MMTQNFSAPKLNAESAPSAGCLWFFLILVVFIYSAIVISFWSSYLKGIRLQTEGVRVNAKIIDINMYDSCDNHGDCGPSYGISYRFTTSAGAQIEGEESIDSDTYLKTDIGDDWPIVYARTEPSIQQSVKAFRTPAQIIDNSLGIMAEFSPYFVLLLITMIIYQRARKRWQTFLHNGTLIDGVITRHWTETDSEGGIRYYCAYNFPKGTETRQEIFNKETHMQLKIGDAVTVRYLPSNPRRSRLE